MIGYPFHSIDDDVFGKRRLFFEEKWLKDEKDSLEIVVSEPI